MPKPSVPPMVTPWTGESDPLPARALKAKVCRCDNDAIVTEEDGERRCLWCGKRERRKAA